MGFIPELPEHIRYLDNDCYGKGLARFRVATIEVAVVNKNNEILICKRKEPPLVGGWWLCGTKLIGPENLEDGAIRALKNEISLIVDANRIINTGLLQFINWPVTKTAPFAEFNQHNVVFVKITEDEEKNIKLRGHEHEEYKFVSLNNQAELIDPLKEIFEKLKEIL